MDKIVRETVFAGMDDRDLAIAFGLEIKRRGCAGVFYFTHIDGDCAAKYGFVLSPALEAIGVREMTPRQQMAVFGWMLEQADVKARENVQAEGDDTLWGV